MLRLSIAADARWFQVIFQAFFLSYGILFLHWIPDWPHYIISIGGCLAFSYIAEAIHRKRFPPLAGAAGWKTWGLSALISAMSLCLLLKTTHLSTSLLAAFLTVASKSFFRINRKHLFNPSAFGITATILITKDAWLSPGQWGNGVLLFFLVLTLGTIVVSRVQKLDTSLGFLLTFAGLLYWRQVVSLGWPQDYFWHSISSGSLLLFSFFMISDPKTAPNHPTARVLWAMGIGVLAFYLSAFKWMNNTPVWMLVALAPLVPVLDKILPAKTFEWQTKRVQIFSKIKKFFMRTKMRKFAALSVLLAMIGNQAMAFCGFYVSKADGTLKNKTSQVILVRDGDRNTITMFNDFKGDIKDFAMVVPVPVVLKKSDIKVVDQSIFGTLNEYSKPRLVEYFDENPCELREYDMMYRSKASPSALNDVVVTGYGTAKKSGVTIEAKYLVGEYDILILSAKESSGLRSWLTGNGYKIPAGADEVLAPYIKSNLKFFVVKVNEEEKKKLPGNFLRPIQISFESPKFMLPIRLGMANSEGDQDMIVYAFSKTGRIECTNYPTVSLPTGKNVPLFVQNNFGNFYSNLFQNQWFGAGKSVAMLEYAWDVSPSNYVKCDPCIASAPTTRDLVQAGVWWTGNSKNSNDPDNEDGGRPAKVYFTRLHVRYNRTAFPQDLFFQETANTGSFQARYIITHPATGDLSCEAGKKYLADLKVRREDELRMLTYLTGKGYTDWDVAVRAEEEKSIPAADSYAAAALATEKPTSGKGGMVIASLGITGLLSIIGLGRRTRKSKPKGPDSFGS